MVSGEEIRKCVEKKVKEIGVKEFIKDPKKVFKDCGLTITDEQAKKTKEQLTQKKAPTVADVMGVLFISEAE